MGNQIIRIEEISKVRNGTFTQWIVLKTGTEYVCSVDDYSLLRIENYLRLPYSKMVTDATKSKISADNKNKNPIILDGYTIIFDENVKNTGDKKTVRDIYFDRIVLYHKLLVHRGSMDSLITKVLENKEEIYSVEFQNKFNDECKKFLEILRTKTTNFLSKL